MKEFFRTSKVTGSRARSPAIGSLLHANDDVEVLVDLRAGAGRHDCGRVNLLDDRGTLKTDAAGQVVALVNGGVEPSPFEPNPASAHRLRNSPRATLPPQFYPRDHSPPPHI